ELAARAGADLLHVPAALRRLHDAQQLRIGARGDPRGSTDRWMQQTLSLAPHRAKTRLAWCSHRCVVCLHDGLERVPGSPGSVEQRCRLHTSGCTGQCSERTAKHHRLGRSTGRYYRHDAAVRDHLRLSSALLRFRPRRRLWKVNDMTNTMPGTAERFATPDRENSLVIGPSFQSGAFNTHAVDCV